MGKRIDYPFEIRPLSPEEGGIFISYPDFSDCLSDGESVEEALTNGKDALKPRSPHLKQRNCQFRRRTVVSPREVRSRSKDGPCTVGNRAKAEGASLNTLVLTFIAARSQTTACIAWHEAGWSVPLRKALSPTRTPRYPLANRAGGQLTPVQPLLYSSHVDGNLHS